jgi:hypothetical protein
MILSTLVRCNDCAWLAVPTFFIILILVGVVQGNYIEKSEMKKELGADFHKYFRKKL